MGGEYACGKLLPSMRFPDDLLTAMPAAGYAYGHEDDIRCEMSDAEIITTAQPSGNVSFQER